MKCKKIVNNKIKLRNKVFLRFLLVLFLLNSITFIQAQSFFFNFVNKDAIAIPYVYLRINKIDSVVKVYVSDFNGKLEIDKVDVANTDTLIFSAIGYYKKIQLAKTLLTENKIRLKEKVYELAEVSIESKNKSFIKHSGTYKNTDWKGCWRGNGSGDSEIAVFIENPIPEEQGLIKEIAIKVVPFTYSDEPLRLHILNGNRTSGPEDEILSESILLYEGKGKRWIKAKLDSMQIPIDENGVFVGIEFLPFAGKRKFSGKELEKIIKSGNKSLTREYLDLKTTIQPQMSDVKNGMSDTWVKNFNYKDCREVDQWYRYGGNCFKENVNAIARVKIKYFK